MTKADVPVMPHMPRSPTENRVWWDIQMPITVAQQMSRFNLRAQIAMDAGIATPFRGAGRTE